MDKYQLVLDIIEHPAKYTEERLAEILSDPETREIYNLLCKADSAIMANKEVDTDAQWADFTRKHIIRPRHHFSWFGSRAASIAAIICTSIVAVAAGIAVTVSVIEHTDKPAVSDEPQITVTPTEIPQETEVHAPTDSIATAAEPVMFVDAPLNAIMEQIAVTYGVQVRFNNDEAAGLHLYYRLNPELTLDEVVAQLNTFEQIDITRNGNTLTID